MQVRSLGLTTELALAATRGRITDRGAYLVVETPDDPGYYHGNVLVLPRAPQPGEVARWTRTFRDELGGNREIRHVTLWWDGVTGDAGPVDELRAAGFTLEVNQVMTADDVSGPAPALPARLLAPADVLATAELRWSLSDRHDEGYRRFLQRRAVWHQQLVARGAAQFWGAHDPRGELVASLGLVQLGTLGRYQDVQIAPAHRRRGLATALLALAAKHALAAGVERLVIVAEPGGAGERVYTRAGFRPLERTASACRYPQDRRAPRP